jgi:ubiquinol-cytochrome c reductase cytochrome c subunit
MRRGGRIALLVAALALGVAGLAEAAPELGIVRPVSEPAKPSVQLGSELFAANCASCHGINGYGIYGPPRRGAGDIRGEGPSLHGVGAEAADLYLSLGWMPLSAYDQEPNQGPVEFSHKELTSLIEYVASLKRDGRAGPGIPHPDPARASLSEGFQAFTLHCSGCHQLAAEGGYATGAKVPPLHTATATQIAEAVRVGPYLMPRFSTRQIPPAQLNAIVKYVLYTDKIDNRGGWRIGNLGPIPEGMVTWFIGIPLLIIGCMLVGRRYRRA